MNYYNEHDPKVAAWLRELIRSGLIPQGEVDERSIEDVVPSDLRGFVQCHFFAGIAGWSYALDLAGWPRDMPVWTGSCPCQPFSAAGQGNGFADERHLWPSWQHLIAQCRPPVVFGEQVASKVADAWIDLVHADMEGMDYAFGCVPFPAAGIGAPHIRDRNYWMAYTDDAGLEGYRRLIGVNPPQGWADQKRHGPEGSMVGRLANPNGRNASTEREQRGWEQRQQSENSGAGGMADSSSAGSLPGAFGGLHSGQESAGARDGELERSGATIRPDALHDPWRASDWLYCRDGKWRPVKSGIECLANGVPARVVRLRGYGNAIVPYQAAQFIRASIEAIADQVESARLAA